MNSRQIPLYLATVLAIALVFLVGCPANTPSTPAAPTSTPTITLSPTITSTLTVTSTRTITSTPTLTSSPTNTATATPNVTPLETHGTAYLESLQYVNGTLYGLTGDGPSLVKFTDNGTNIGVAYTTTLTSPAFYYSHMAVTVNGGNVTFFLANSSTNQVQVYRDTGSAFAPVTSFTSGGYFNPRGMALDGAGTIFVSDLNNGGNQIQPFQYNFTTNTATAGTPIDTIAVGNQIPGAWANAGPGVYYVVSNSTFALAKVYRYSGSPLAAGVTFGGSGGLSGGTDQMAVDPISGDIFVADSATVKRYNPSGTLIYGFDPSSYPLSFAFDGLGHLYVGTLNSLQKINTP